jgi:hypothetical protein
MNPTTILKEVEDCLSFALKQADASGYIGYAPITRARAKTLLNDIRAVRHQEKSAPRREPAWASDPEGV